MKSFGCAAISDFLGDRIVYRNLVPADKDLPALAEVQRELGLTVGRIPRKTEPDYARVIAWLLQRARDRSDSETAIKYVLFIGDTLRNDVAAFDNICQAGNWLGAAFIGAETPQPEEVILSSTPSGRWLYRANRWQLLYEFDAFCASHTLPIGETAAVLVDLDKTAIGARGRNDHVIDQVRLDALQQVLSDLHALDLDPAALKSAYHELRQAEYHPLTEDNQDYLAYICLIITSGAPRLADLVHEFRQGTRSNFSTFIANVEARRSRLPPPLLAVHDEVYASVRSGDPTPFKRFRSHEYVQTIHKMRCLEDTPPAETLISERIVITQELRALAALWQERGALLFGLSDKPDEASIPGPRLAAQGWLPIHRQPAHSVGL